MNLRKKKKRKNESLMISFITSTSISSEILRLFNADFDNKQSRLVSVKLNGRQALFSLSIRTLIKSIVCDDERFFPLKTKTELS